MANEVSIEVTNSVLLATLNRPDKLNAFNETQLLSLAAAIDQARLDPDIRCVLLTGAGRGFCAGQDLGDRDPRAMDGPVDLGDTLGRLYNPLVRAMRDLPKPIVCAVNGVAAGAGANIALACDIVIAARSAKFIEPFCNLGLVPDSGGTWMLPRLIGEARAKALALTGTAVSAEEAVAWGMIWQVVDNEDLMSVATTLAEKLARGPTFGLGLTKMTIQAAADNSLDAQLDVERDIQRRLGRSADYAEGVAAFLDKRPAAFTGQE